MHVCDPPMRRCAPTQRRRACGCKLTWVSPSVARSLPAAAAAHAPAPACVRAWMPIHLTRTTTTTTPPHVGVAGRAPVPAVSACGGCRNLLTLIHTATARLIQRWHHLMCVLDRSPLLLSYVFYYALVMVIDALLGTLTTANLVV
jgi:hypothetical protein